MSMFELIYATFFLTIRCNAENVKGMEKATALYHLKDERYEGGHKP